MQAERLIVCPTNSKFSNKSGLSYEIVQNTEDPNLPKPDHKLELGEAHITSGGISSAKNIIFISWPRISSNSDEEKNLEEISSVCLQNALDIFEDDKGLSEEFYSIAIPILLYDSEIPSPKNLAALYSEVLFRFCEKNSHLSGCKINLYIDNQELCKEMEKMPEHFEEYETESNKGETVIEDSYGDCYYFNKCGKEGTEEYKSNYYCLQWYDNKMYEKKNQSPKKVKNKKKSGKNKKWDKERKDSKEENSESY